MAGLGMARAVHTSSTVGLGYLMPYRTPSLQRELFELQASRESKRVHAGKARRLGPRHQLRTVGEAPGRRLLMRSREKGRVRKAGRLVVVRESSSRRLPFLSKRWGRKP